nr:hypothetical protein [Massilia sp. CCM 8734]
MDSANEFRVHPTASHDKGCHRRHEQPEPHVVRDEAHHCPEHHKPGPAQAAKAVATAELVAADPPLRGVGGGHGSLRDFHFRIGLQHDGGVLLDWHTADVDGLAFDPPALRLDNVAFKLVGVGVLQGQPLAAHPSALDVAGLYCGRHFAGLGPGESSQPLALGVE